MSKSTPTGGWVTDDDYSSIPCILSWIIGIVVFLCVVAKLVTKLFLRNSMAIDDATITISWAFSVGMIASVTVAGYNGLGTRQDNLDESQIRVFEKSIYASDLLFILTLFFSKLSMLAIIRFLSGVRNYMTQVRALVGILSLWTISSLFAAAFQCPTPDTWAILSDKCFDQRAFWTSFNAINIATELLMFALAAQLIHRVSLHRDKKTKIFIIFALRLLIISGVVVEIVYLQKVTKSSNDRTFNMWPVQLCRQFVTGSSIIFASVPFMKPFFGAFLRGMPTVRKSMSYSMSKTYTSLASNGAQRSWTGPQRRWSNWLAFRPDENHLQSEGRPQVSNGSSVIETTTTVDIYTEDRHQSASSAPSALRNMSLQE